jgi:hypothetical protein
MWQVRGTGEVHTGFWWGDLMEKNNLEDLSIDGKIILKWMGWGGMDWIDMARDRVRCRDLVNEVMKHRGSIKCGEFLD